MPERLDGPACPYCGSRPVRLQHPLYPWKGIVVGGAHCKCQEVAALERAREEAIRRERRARMDEFWRMGGFLSYRRARLEDLRPNGNILRVVQAARSLLCKAQGGLYLYGAPGTGKTHVCCAVLAAAAEAGEFAIPVTVPGLLATIRASWHEPDAAVETWLRWLETVPFHRRLADHYLRDEPVPLLAQELGLPYRVALGYVNGLPVLVWARFGQRPRKAGA